MRDVGSRLITRTTGGALMASPDRTNAMDHVVVVMFENRSFDNLLGRLYEPGEVESFEG
jgi:phospholipase C